MLRVMQTLETDYLVVGAGAAGMAFTDALLTHSDATITIVDRGHSPGGHWLDAYPFVRLHQPSAFYGVDSVPLGQDAIDTTGTNAGFYELAAADEIRAYFERVMHRHFLATGRVRYFPCSDYVGERRFVSRLTGESCEVNVRRKIIDTTYVATAIPATSPPPFAVAEGVRCVTPNELPRVGPIERVVIHGGGKTALDTCVWLLERGVPAGSIRWVRPREGWWMNRKFQQPHTLLPDFIHGNAIQIEAMAEATSVDDLLVRLEAEGIFFRLDRAITPTMLHGGITSEAELALARRVEDVIRLGHVQKIERDEIVLADGRVPNDARTIHVHCASRGLGRPPRRPIFEKERVTVQPFMWGFACYQFALLGAIEAMVDTDEAKNALCPPVSYWDRNEDYPTAFVAMMAFTTASAAYPALNAWSKASRLNPTSALPSYKTDPRVASARERIRRFALPAAMNVQKILDRGR
jgi:hypothetical protein